LISFNPWWCEAQDSGCIRMSSISMNPPYKDPPIEETIWNKDDIRLGSNWVGCLLGSHPPPHLHNFKTVTGFKRGNPNEKMMDIIVCKDRNKREWEFSWEYFLEAYEPYEPYKLIVEAGTTCKSCNRDYPYAEATGDFECWGCKNGY